MFNFFQTLSACHTVQVAGNEDDNEENLIPQTQEENQQQQLDVQQTNQLIANNNSHSAEEDEEQLQTVTAFNHITEENENNTAPESDADEVDLISKRQQEIRLISNGK